MERLGLGPDVLLAANPKLVYGRMTGWGQDGPLARAPATTSTTSRCPARCTRSGAPAGRRCRRSTSSATSAAAACCSRSASPARSSRRGAPGRGQVVDAAMIEGASLLTTMFWGMQRGAAGGATRAATNILDSGAPWYDTYATQDGKLRRHRRDRAQVLRGAARSAWGSRTRRCRRRTTAPAGPCCAQRFAAVFATKTRDEWCAHLRRLRRLFCAGADVRRGDAAPAHLPRAMRTLRWTASLSPRRPRAFRARPAPCVAPPPERGARGREALADWGFADDEVDDLRALGMGFRD